MSCNRHHAVKKGTARRFRPTHAAASTGYRFHSKSRLSGCTNFGRQDEAEVFSTASAIDLTQFQVWKWFLLSATRVRSAVLPPAVPAGWIPKQAGPPFGRSCLKAKRANALKSISSMISLRGDPVLTLFKTFVHAPKGVLFKRSDAVSESSLREHRR